MSDPNPSPTVDYGRNTNRADILIIGAGIPGMTTAIEMIRKRNGRNFIIVEKGYLESLIFSIFRTNPNWTREYPGQEEILDYLVSIAHKYQLYRHIRFNTSVEEARWDDTSNTWKRKINRLGSKDSEFGKEYTITSDFLVSAVGQLNVPKYPDINGIGTFEGKVMHSARWDWDYDLRDKRIGIIGNGATAAQIIPEIAKVCKSLTVFQRTPNWVIPRNDKPISATWQSIFKHVPLVRSRYRASLMDFRESFFDAVFDSKSPVHEFMMSASKNHLVAQLPGEKYAKLRDHLQPHYAIGCKRVIVTDDYFLTFTRPNAVLETTQIDRVTQKGVKVEGGNEHEFDLLVLATGFKTTQFMYPIKIFRSNGKPIEKIWESGASAYLGMTVSSMPNFSMLYGPNTNLGHNSIILMIEAQALYINTLITQVKNAKKNGKNLRIEPKEKIVQAYNDEIQGRLRRSAFADPNCNSWYKNEAGLITNNWSDVVIPYQERTSTIQWDEFEITGSGAEELKTKGKTSWPRVIEETQVSNGMILTGLIMAAGAVVTGTLYRNGLKSFLGS